ncbi:hypothetical protein [Brachybacterium tyrofermentans]|uniref:hypothetical protein n=1 Tax=Brachybacterium tyrofermentans TaxID=47848 RepID=UPI00366AB80A
MGTVPDLATSAALMGWAVEVGEGTSAWTPGTESQTVSTSTNGASERVHVIHNWSWEPSVFTVPGAVRAAVSGEELAEGTELKLGAWDARVVIEKA